MELDPARLKEMLLEGRKDESGENYVIKPVVINDDGIYSPYSPHQFIYGKYDEDLDQTLYSQCLDREDRDTFSRYYRLKLLYYLLKAPIARGGCDLQLSELLYDKKIEAFYPLHEFLKIPQVCICIYGIHT